MIFYRFLLQDKRLSEILSQHGWREFIPYEITIQDEVIRAEDQLGEQYRCK